MANMKVEVIVFRLDPAVEILLLHRPASRGGIWQPVTGKVEKGETVLEGALRELKEETGIDEEHIMRIIDNVYSFDFTDGNVENKEEVFGVEVDADTVVDISKNIYVEHDRFEWMAPEKAESAMFWSTNVSALKKLIEKIR